MWIHNVPLATIRAIAKRMCIALQEQKIDKDAIQLRIWPRTGSSHYRAKSKTSRPRVSLCYHAQYAFMSQLLAHHPEAIIKTWVTTWNHALFQAGARAWTENELRDRANKETCDCTPEMIEEALLSPDELRAK